MTNENTKHQAPAYACGYGVASQICDRVEAKRRRANTKEAPIPKLQTLASAAHQTFGTSGLGFIWSLVFGFWCFALS